MMRNKTNRLKTSLLKVAIIVIIVHSGGLLLVQNYELEIDKAKGRELEKKRELDSLMVHIKNYWQISSSPDDLFFHP